MIGRKLRLEYYEPGHNVSLWLHRLNTERHLRQWPDPVVVAEASLFMGDVPLTWFLTHCTLNTTWEQFEHGMKQRFGDNEHSIMARITHSNSKNMRVCSHMLMT